MINVPIDFISEELLTLIVQNVEKIKPFSCPRDVRDVYMTAHFNCYLNAIILDERFASLTSFLLEHPLIKPADYIENVAKVAQKGTYAWRVFHKILMLGSDLNFCGQGENAMFHAFEKRNMKIFKLLLNYKDKLGNSIICVRNGDQLLKTAIAMQEIDIVKTLLTKSEINPSFFSNFPIIYASLKGCTSIVELLLKDLRVNPADQDNAALKSACKKGHLEIVKLLLQDARVTITEEAVKNAFEAKNIPLITMFWFKVDRHSMLKDTKFQHLLVDLFQDATFCTNLFESLNIPAGSTIPFVQFTLWSLSLF